MMEKTISSKLIHRGRQFSFKSDRVRLPSGRETTRDIVDHPGAVCVLPVHDDGIIMVRQYRYAAGEALLELPAGTLERGEDPLGCAVRELREETGYAASSWEHLLSFYMAPGYSNEVIHIYLATGLSEVGEAPEEDEDITVESFGFDEVLTMIEENTLRDAKSIAGVLAYLTRN